MVKKTFRKKKLKKAVVFGSTGLVGRSLVNRLLNHPEYEEVLCVQRKNQDVDNPKYKEAIVDFSNPDEIIKYISGNEVYCCLGTTIKKAGSKENFEHVDLELPLIIGKACQEKKTEHYLVVSSIGADAKSGNFYLRTKGRMEKSVKGMDIPHKTIARPSMLLGMRGESRPGEEIGKVLMKIVSPFMFGNWKKYRAIQADDVAAALVIIANSSPTSQVVFESDELREIAESES